MISLTCFILSSSFAETLFGLRSDFELICRETAVTRFTAEGQRPGMSGFCHHVVIGKVNTVEVPAVCAPRRPVGQPHTHFDVRLFARSTVTQSVEKVMAHVEWGGVGAGGGGAGGMGAKMMASHDNGNFDVQCQTEEGQIVVQLSAHKDKLAFFSLQIFLFWSLDILVITLGKTGRIEISACWQVLCMHVCLRTELRASIQGLPGVYRIHPGTTR